MRRYIERDRILAALLLAAGTYFVVYYLSDPGLPGGAAAPFAAWWSPPKSSSLGWFGGYDQGQYLHIAHVLARFQFGQLATRATYTYGVGYPVVAVPAIWLGIEREPFVFFDLFAFLFVTYAVYRAGSKLISPVGGFLAAFGLVFATPLIGYVDQPLNSTISLTCMGFLLLTLAQERVTRGRAFAIGLMLGWAFAARFIDIVWLALIAIGCVYRGAARDMRRHVLPAALGVLLVVLPILYLNYRTYGSAWSTPYVNHLRAGGGSDQGLASYHLRQVPNSFLAIFVSPLWAGAAITYRGLLINFFWALGAIPGFVVLWRRDRYRAFLLVAAVTVVLDYVFYLSFRASYNGSLQYGVLHYFKDLWPVITLFATGLLEVGVRRLSGRVVPQR